MVRVKESKYEIMISGRNDGTVDAVYITLAQGKVARTRELNGDALLADYNAKGELLGLEILAPVKLADVVRQVKPSSRRSLRNVLVNFAPQDLFVDS